jgi:ribosomal protein S3
MNLILQNTYQSNTKQQTNNPYFNFNKENSNADLLIRSYFKSAFTNCLISKINYKNSQNKVEIQFFFYFIDSKNTKNLDYNNTTINKIDIKNLSILLENIYEKKVCLVINRIYYPYINAQILSEYLGMKSQSNTFINFKRSIIKNTVLQINNLSAFIVGIKIQVHGRIITERVIPRKTQKYKILGTFTSKNANKQIKIDKGQIHLKNELGAFTITVELALKMNIYNKTLLILRF